MSLKEAAQAVVDSLDKPDSAVERLRLARLVEVLRKELSMKNHAMTKLEYEFVNGEYGHQFRVWSPFAG